MGTQGMAMRKITISLPVELVDFADRRAGQMNSSRSQIISGALAETKAREEARLAAEGYQYYAHEAEAFAALSAQAVAEAWGAFVVEEETDAGAAR
jgi:metal-responsive CopG/Arc/MetJ family transcriptional regulator